MSNGKDMSTAAIRLAKALAIGGIAVGVAVGCSSEDSAASQPSDSVTQSESLRAESGEVDGEHNDADVTFNQHMIPHHRQAIAMADLVVPERTENAEIVQLAERIRAEQQAELDDMIRRLEAWNVELPPATDDVAPGDVDGGGHDMDGMLTAEQMTELANATGEEFERLWLNAMIFHHQGAITMADTELADGVNPPSRALAELIKDEQGREIDEMKDLLKHYRDDHSGDW